MLLSTVPEPVHIVIPTFHKSFVYITKPQWVQQHPNQSDGDHRTGSHMVVEALHQCIHDQHGQEQGSASHQHLHFGVASGLGQFLIQMDGYVVIDRQLEDEGEHGACRKQQASQCSQPRDFSLHDGHQREEQRDNQHQALIIVLRLEQRQHRFSTHHQAIDVIALHTHDGRQGHHPKASKAIHADEHLHEWPVVINIGKGEESAQHQHA